MLVLQREFQFYFAFVQAFLTLVGERSIWSFLEFPRPVAICRSVKDKGASFGMKREEGGRCVIRERGTGGKEEIYGGEKLPRESRGEIKYCRGLPSEFYQVC